MDETLGKWLDRGFVSTSTKATYEYALKKFMKVMGIADLRDYLAGKPDGAEDLKEFYVKLTNGKMKPKTIVTYGAALKSFLLDHGVNITSIEWRQISQRGFKPKRSWAVTRDKANTRAELRQILEYCNIKSKSLFLFLLSSGARIGETIHLTKTDLELDHDPPLAHIKGENTKNGVGQRTVPMSHEARDAIRSWLAIKDDITKKDRSNYFGEIVWNFVPNSARAMWNLALKKASLDERDKNTGRRVFHIHGLRKFFRTQIGLNQDQREVIMGHAGYLDEAYRRWTEADWKELWAEYRKQMHRVTLGDVPREVEDKVNDLTTENAELRRKIEGLEADKYDLHKAIDVIIETNKRQFDEIRREIEDLKNPEGISDAEREFRNKWMASPERKRALATEQPDA